MRNKLLLSVAALLFASVAALAQWEKPVPKATDFAERDTFYLYNVGSGMFFAAANDWNTRASVSTNGQRVMFVKDLLGGETYMFRALVAAKERWCWVGGNTGATIGDINCWADAPNDGAYTEIEDWETANNAGKFSGYPGTNTWVVTATQGGYYLTNEIYSGLGDGTADKFGHFGVSEKVEGKTDNTRLYFYDDGMTYTGEESETLNFFGGEFYDLWTFVTPEDYEKVIPELERYAAAMDLAAALEEAKAYEAVDASAAQTVYNNTASTTEELTEAAKTLRDLIAAAKAYEILKYGDDNMSAPSEDNPCTRATELIKNNDFSQGDIEGWTCTFVSGKNAVNVGYQGSSYTNGDVQISQFIEAWTNANYNPNCSWAAIGDGELSQTMAALPQGKYKFTVDCIAVAQWGNPNPVKGVELFAKGGEIDNFENIATGDALPEHFELTFVSTGGDVTLGLRTNNATANWIAADNFTLTYYGEVKVDPYKVLLDELLSKLEDTYQNVDNVAANEDVKDAFATAYEDAQAATDNFQEHIATVNEANEALTASIALYKEIAAYIDELAAKMDELGQTWPDLREELADTYDALEGAYNDGEATETTIEETKEKVSLIIADYISENVKEGDDITVLLNNPGFDKDFSGWELTENSTSPVWGGAPVTYTNLEGDEVTLTGGNAERYHAAFDMFQTIKNMPKGLFTLSCQAFERDDNGKGIEAELYAILPNGSVQTVKLMDLNEEGCEEKLYDGSNGQDKRPDVTSGATGLWIPDGMNGSNIYFAEGFYKNKLDIVMIEKGDLTIGIRTTSTGDWVLFDDFRIVYQGAGANVYRPVIEELSQKAEAVGTNDGDILTTEAINKIDTAIRQGAAAVTSEECIAAIEALNEAISFGEQTLKLTARLQRLYTMTTEYRMIPVASSYEGLPTLVDDIGGALDEGVFDTNAQVEEYIIALNREFTKYVQFDQLNATEESPADLTSVIYNPNGYDYDALERGLNGWTLTDCNAGFYTVTEGEEATAEFFNQPFDLRQTIYGLAPGWYRLGVYGYYRNGGYDDVANALNGEINKEDSTLYSEDKLVTLFAGKAQTPLLIISADLEAYQALAEGATITVNGDKKFIPDNMAQASAAFQNDMYKNILQFQVAEGEESIEIGIKKTETVKNDWTMFGWWSLEYIGTATPTTDPTTLIQGVDAEAPAKAVIYNLAGQRVVKAQKGIYIINGKKVVVK